ncbi:hypothetical protein SRABI128_05100 [Microbacterium sp. Bi128]|nr:hypothetical protein SRABI128_05100 [Microbacterium sp. Bi128]
MWCSARQIRSTASAASLAPSSASRRMSYGVPPACRASPSTTSEKRRADAIDDTAASGSPARSSSGPCSMCASRYPTSSSGLRAASPMRPGSRPNSRNACRSVEPSASVRSHHDGSHWPATADDPSSALPKRVPSSSENAMTSSANGNGLDATPSSSTRRTSRTTSSAISTPTMPSKRPASGTVSRCEPSIRAGASRSPAGARRPTWLPAASWRVDMPSSRIHSAARRFTLACSGER